MNKTEVFWLDDDNGRMSLSVSLSCEWRLKDFYPLSKKYCKEQLSFCDIDRSFFFEVLCARYTIMVPSIWGTSAERKPLLYVHCFTYIYLYVHAYIHTCITERKQKHVRTFIFPKAIIGMHVVDYIETLILYWMMSVPAITHGQKERQSLFNVHYQT